MQVAIHLGAHCTDEDRLLKSLLANKDLLAEQGISVPGPGRYREMLQNLARDHKGRLADADTQARIREAILHDQGARRVVLSDENFICVHGRIFENGVLYEKSSYKTQWFRNLFPEDEVEFLIAIRNPASLIPVAFHHPAQRYGRFDRYLAGTDVMDVRWSDVILTIRENNPDCPLTVWCNEDAPLIWPEILSELSKHDPDKPLGDDFGLLQSIMDPAGMDQMHIYLAENPPKSDEDRRGILAAFLEKFAIEQEVVEELDAPGWTDDLVAELTALYEADMDEIAKISGVTFLVP